MQPAVADVELCSSKLSLRKLIDVQDADKLSEPDDRGLHIECQVGKGTHKVSWSKTSPVCHSSIKCDIGVVLDRVLNGNM